MSRHEELLRQVSARVIPIEDRDELLRGYCTSVCQSWELQIRTPRTKGHGVEGKRAVAAIAVLEVDDMIALREWIDAHLAERARLLAEAESKGLDVRTVAVSESIRGG